MTVALKILPLFLVLSFQGCNLWDYLKPPSREPALPQGSRTEARELLYSYLNSRVVGESTENLRAYLTEEAWNDYRSGNLTLQSGNSKEFVGYKILDETDLSGGRYAFTTVMQGVDRVRPQAENTTEDLIVSFSNDEYRVSSARLLQTTTIRTVGEDLIWVGAGSEGKESEVKIFDLQDFPPRMAPIGGTNEQEFGVGRNGYSTVVLNPEGQRAAFGTSGTHGAMAVLTWEGKIPAPGRVKLIPLDLFYGGRVKLLSFSPDSKYLATEIASPAGTDRVEIYRSDQRNKLNFQLEQAFPIEQYHISFQHWEVNSKSILLRVTSGPEQTGVEEKLGTWRINIQTGEREKVIGD